MTVFNSCQPITSRGRAGPSEGCDDPAVVVFLLVAGLVLLVAGGELLVRGASGLGRATALALAESAAVLVG